MHPRVGIVQNGEVKELMNRTLTLLLSLASIFFLFGSLVVAEEGSSNLPGLTTTAALTTQQKAALEKEKMEQEREKLKEKWEAEKERIKSLKVVSAKIAITTTGSVNSDDVRAEIEAKIAERRAEQLAKLAEKKAKAIAKLEKRLAARDLEGREKLIARLRLAVESSDDADLTVRAELKALLERLENKTSLTTAEQKEIEDKIRAYKKEHLNATATRLIANAESVSTKLESILKRIKSKMDELDVLIPGSKIRMETVYNKLTRINTQLDARIDAAKAAQAAFVISDEGGNTNALRAELHRLRSWSKIGVKSMTRLVAMINHYQNQGEDADDDVLDAYAADVLDVSAAADVVESEVADVFALTETTVPAADVVVETDDSGMDSSDDINDAPDDSDGRVDDDDSDDEEDEDNSGSGGNNS